jgi:four helix bundle protein
LTHAAREGARAALQREQKDRVAMLRIYDVVLEVVAGVRPVVGAIERRDPDLARQMRRAVSSVALNVSEGMYSRGKNRAARYHNAMGSMRETMACIEVSVALGYVDAVDGRLRSEIDHVIGTLYKLCV